MKRAVLSFLLVVTIFIGVHSCGVNVSAEGASVWSGTVSLSEVRNIKESHVNLPFYCYFQQVSQLEYGGEYGTIIGDNPLIEAKSSLIDGESCTIDNTQGTFRLLSANNSNFFGYADLYSPNYDTQRLIKAANSITPAPKGNYAIKTHKRFPYSNFYDIALYRSFKNWGKIVLDSDSKYKWTIDSLTEYSSSFKQIKFSNGSKVEVVNHRFSDNGRYVVFHSREGVWITDLTTMERTMVASKWNFDNANKPIDLAVSNDGKLVALSDSNENLIIYSTESCSVIQAPGEWELYFGAHGDNTNPGCEYIGNFKSKLSHLLQRHSEIKRLLFSPNGSELYFSLSSSTWNAPSDVYSWKEFKFRTEDYQSQAGGYLAMGDSFSSGEGDTEGGTWYEPGTDEQGNIDTFAGRNLCHLSRRSYPYLIAQELGFLASRNKTPERNGQFHSVACSGAKIHNVIGGGESGEKHTPGNKEDFEERDNQYRFDRLSSLFLWQPGVTKQIAALSNWNSPDADTRNSFNPEIITLGIGGNDAGFGDFLGACVQPSTCDFAKPGTSNSYQQGILIVNLKNKLTKAYKEIKKTAPEARIYVHGYPVFIRGEGGNCGLNVRLDGTERMFTKRTIEYVNDVIEAAAKEAGVYYVDIENIFSGGRLCDGVSEELFYVNGATKGNDIDLLFVSEVIGKESFHPTPRGFVRYKQQILLETDYLRAPMPAPEAVAIPVPPADLFGDKVANYVQSINAGESNSSWFYTRAVLFVKEQGKEVVKLFKLLPHSTAKVYVHSTPTHLGDFEISEDGTLQAEIELPAELDPGYHQLQIEAYDQYGVLRTYYQPFYMPVSSTDFDGDGVPDDEDSCPTLYDAGIDQDNDRIDDVCDGVIVTRASSETESNISSSTTNTTSQTAPTTGEEQIDEGEIADQNNDEAAPSQQTPLTTQQNGGTLGATNTRADLAKSNDSVGLVWWLVAACLSIISIATIIVKKLAYAETD